MARTHARILTSIWQDKHFLALSATAQRMYMLALSQPGLTSCGVVSYTPRRWATLAAGSTPRSVARDVDELVRSPSRFVIVDLGTEELLVRTFAKNDGVLSQPNVVIAMWRSAAEIVSDAIRCAFVEGLPEGFRKGLPEAFPEGLPEGLGEALSRAGARVPPPPPAPTPSPPPAGSVNGSPLVVRGSEEEEQLLRKEAEHRLANRKPGAPAILSRQKWLRTTMDDIRVEWTAKRAQELDAATKWGETLARCGRSGTELVASVRERYGEDRERRLTTLRSCRATRLKLVAA